MAKSTQHYNLKEVGLFCLMLGIVMTLIGALLSNWTIIVAGIFIFFLSIPLFLIHFFRGRRPVS